MVISVPKELSIKVNYAQLLMKTEPVSMDIRSEEAVLETKTSPVRLEIRNRAFFDSIGLKSPDSIMREDLQKSSDAALRAAGKCTREASAMMGPHGMTVADIARSRFLNPPMPSVELVPIAQPAFRWDTGGVTGEYSPYELLIQWDTGSIQKRYLPYSVEVAVAEWKNIPQKNDNAEESI